MVKSLKNASHVSVVRGTNNAVVNSDVIAIPEEDAIFVNDNELKILGNRPFFFFKNGELQEMNFKYNVNMKKL